MWSSIAFHRRAPRQNPDAEKKPTMVVFCCEGSTCDFTTVYHKLADVLTKVPVKLYVEIAVGSVALCQTAGKPDSVHELPLKPLHGSSIGILDDSVKGGTPSHSFDGPGVW